MAIRWTPEVIRLLGTMADERLAAIVGCSRVSVRNARVQRGIESFDTRGARRCVPVGTVRERLDRNGKRRAWIFDGERWRLRAHVAWEREHGRGLPRGRIVHHRNFDTLDDAPHNLEALTRGEHARIHRAAGHLGA